MGVSDRDGSRIHVVDSKEYMFLLGGSRGRQKNSGRFEASPKPEPNVKQRTG